jgi:peptide chain release factor 3
MDLSPVSALAGGPSAAALPAAAGAPPVAAPAGSGNVAAEAARRRTFAIIAHPDAGKTTLTEKLLLKGGAIQLAGQVRAKGNARRTRSDWMKIEQDRGISVATSVMTFERGGLVFNLLDTPGHEDFSEDTYRTLTAVDAAVMVLDAAKGIEAQTRKLFEVCRLRDIPIVTFVNKMDREGRDPFELIDEIEKTLALDAAPVAWPVGRAGEFAGTYDLLENRFLPVDATDEAGVDLDGPDDPRLAALVGEERAARLAEESGLALAACPEFDLGCFREGTLTPVFFGSALRDFGVGHLLDGLARHAPPPGARPADPRPVQPGEPALTGFVFKVQANMDPNHRDRVAFVRLCSGRLWKGMRLRQVRTGKQVPVNAPLFFFAKDRQVAEEAWPGDVVGIANHGTLRIGDTLTEGEALNFRGVPSFAPEILRTVRLEDPMLAKKLRTALAQLAEEGVVQLFRPLDGSPPVVGVVGQLQLDVLQSRLRVEYGIPAGFDATRWETMRWVVGEDRAALERFMASSRSDAAEDHDGEAVMFFGSDWRRGRAEEEWPMLRFHAVREQHGIVNATAGR